MAKLRKQIFPKHIVDFLFMVFIVVIIPLAYWFEVFIVLPFVHPDNSLAYIFHLILATFMLLNVTSNYVFMILTDTSVKSVQEVEAVKKSESSDSQTWRFCIECDTLIPPRAWHCRICKTCILRRDHHCQFSGCCVGHKNYRYFFNFVLCFAFSAAYMFVINAYFLSHNFELKHLHLLACLVCPLSMTYALHAPSDVTADELYFVFFALNVFGVVVSLFSLNMHGSSIVRGLVLHEHFHNVSIYDLGSAKENIKQVLGHRWYLTWVSPLVHSELPCDGVNWVSDDFRKTKVM